MEKEKLLNDLKELIKEGESLIKKAPSIIEIEHLTINLILHMDYKKWRLSALNLLRINFGKSHSFYKSLVNTKCRWTKNLGSKDPHYYSYTEDSIAEECAVLIYIKEQIEKNRIENIELEYGINLLSNFLEQAQILCENKYFEAAAIYGRLVIENHINELINKHEIKIDAKKIPPKLEKLRQENIIDLPTERMIQSLYDIGNFAAHNDERFLPYKNRSKLTDFLTMIKTKILAIK